MTNAVQELLAAHRRRRGGWAVCLSLFDCMMFAGLVALATLRLASIAHDAGHLNYTGNRSLDKMIARVAFLPALQPFGTWEIAHNVIHHSWTSIRGKDYVWIPKSKQEFDALPSWRQGPERLYRGSWGHGVYHLFDLWIFALLWVLAAARSGQSPAVAMLYGVVLPFLTWCELFGLTLYLQHTHPRARFFADRSEWDFLPSQAAASVHARFPRGIEWLLHGIFEHTAHHLDTAIPFYELHAAQQELDRAFSGSNVVYRWSWREFLRCCRTCKLYDYTRHCSLDFEGNVTA